MEQRRESAGVSTAALGIGFIVVGLAVLAVQLLDLDVGAPEFRRVVSPAGRSQSLDGGIQSSRIVWNPRSPSSPTLHAPRAIPSPRLVVNCTSSAR